MDNKELLEEYSKELGLRTTITLDSLIKSHKILREEFRKDQKTRLEEITKGIEYGVKLRLTSNYVDINTFFDRPLRDIINQYYEE